MPTSRPPPCSSPDGRRPPFVGLGKRVVVTLLPGTAANASLFTDLNVGGRGYDTKVLPGTGLSALVTVFERGRRGAHKGCRRHLADRGRIAVLHLGR